MEGVRVADLACWAVLALALASQACGKVTSTTDTDATPPTPGPAPSPPYYVTVGASGVSPQVTHVWQGRTVIFRNQDSRAHTFFDDPHPSHHECSGVLNLGTLRPGEVREISGLPADACFFHSDDDPADRAFWGAVVSH